MTTLTDLQAEVAAAAAVEASAVALIEELAAQRQAAVIPAIGYANFYGANAHWNYWWSAQQIVDHLHSIGATMLRMDTGGFDPANFGRVWTFARDIGRIDPAIRFVACLNGGFNSTTEATEYASAYAGARAVAQSLGSVGVRIFECGNELTTDARVWPVSSLPGDMPDQYTGGRDWRCMRGCLRGLMDGVKSVDPSYRTGVDFCVAQIAASDMLWNGMEPDGTTGQPALRWDITMWHNYRVYGDPFSLGTTGHGKGFNLMAYIAAAYGRPIMITEWNANPEDSDAIKAPFTTNYLKNLFDNRKSLKIESSMLYQMDGGPADFGLFVFPQQTAAFAAFTASNKP
jgi:hypothetical protein